MGNVVKITEANFDQEVSQSSLPVFVDFYSDWCQPCKRMAPVVEELSVAFANKVKVGKVDVEENAGLAGKFGIMSIPTVIIFKVGKVVKQTTGYQPKEKWEEMLNGVL